MDTTPALAASAKVFAIKELLVAIITSLPIEDISKLRHVSKAWHVTITTDFVIKTTWIQKPIKTAFDNVVYSVPPYFPTSRFYDWPPSPIYGTHVTLVKHPKIRWASTTHRLLQGEPFAIDQVRFSLRSMPGLRRNAKQRRSYVTNPPVQAIQSSWAVGERITPLCVVYNRNGVTFGDLLNHFEKIYPDRKECNEEMRWNMFAFDRPCREGAEEGEGSFPVSTHRHRIPDS